MNNHRCSCDTDNLIPNTLEKSLTETPLKVDSSYESNNMNEDGSSYDGGNSGGMRGLLAVSPSGVSLTRRRSRRGAVSGEVYTEEDAASYVKKVTVSHSMSFLYKASHLNIISLISAYNWSILSHFSALFCHLVTSLCIITTLNYLNLNVLSSIFILNSFTD